METEKYKPTTEDIKRAEENLIAERRIQSEAHEEGFNLGKEKSKTGEEKFDSQPSPEGFANFETAEANGRAVETPEYAGKFDMSRNPLTPVAYLLQRTDGNYEVHINPNRYISGRMEGMKYQGLFDFDLMKTDTSYTSKIPAVIKLNGDGSFKVISKGEVVQR